MPATNPLAARANSPGWTGGRVTPPSGFDVDPHFGMSGDPKARLDAATKQLQAYQAKIKLLQLEKSKIKKPNPKDAVAFAWYKTQVAKYDAQIKAINGSVADLQKKIPDLQTKYYTSTGQYDKLLSGQNKDAFMALQALFKSYGLESLAGKIYEYVKNGESADTISIQLQDTAEYKERFAGNEARKKAGLAVLSPAEYLSTEAAYKDIMRQSGLPQGFYDSKSDSDSWIGLGVSPKELQSRVDMATQATVLANPQYRKALNQMGIDDSHIAAYFMDTDRAIPFLQKAAATAQIGAEALRQNLSFDQGYAEELATQGISADQARQGYQQIAGEMDTMTALGSIYGDQWNQRLAEQAAFQGSSEAVSKQRRLLSRERGAFGGATGGARGGLGQAGGAR